MLCLQFHAPNTEWGILLAPAVGVIDDVHWPRLIANALADPARIKQFEEDHPEGLIHGPRWPRCWTSILSIVTGRTRMHASSSVRAALRRSSEYGFWGATTASLCIAGSIFPGHWQGISILEFNTSSLFFESFCIFF